MKKAKPISQKVARAAIKQAETLRAQVLAAEADRDRIIDRAKADDEYLNNRIRERDATIATLRAKVKDALVLRDARDVTEWNSAPQEVRAAVRYAGRAGCVLVLEERTTTEWPTGSPVERVDLVVTSYAQVKP